MKMLVKNKLGNDQKTSPVLHSPDNMLPRLRRIAMVLYLLQPILISFVGGGKTQRTVQVRQSRGYVQRELRWITEIQTCGRGREHAHVHTLHAVGSRALDILHGNRCLQRPEGICKHKHQLLIRF